MAEYDPRLIEEPPGAERFSNALASTAGSPQVSGGSPIEQLLNSRIQQLQDIEKGSYLSRAFGGRARAESIQAQLPQLAQVVESQQNRGIKEQLAGAQMAQIQQGLFKGVLDIADTLGTLNLPDEAQNKIIEHLIPAISFSTGGGAVKTAGGSEQFDLASMLKPILAGQTKGSALVGLMEDFTPEEKAYVARASRGDKTGKAALDEIKKIRDVKDQKIGEGLTSKLFGLGPATEPRTVVDVVKTLNLNAQEQRLLGAMKPEQLQQYGIMAKDPSILKAEARATAEGKMEGGAEHLGVEFARFAKELYPNKNPKDLAPDEAAKVNDRIRSERVEVSAQQGAAGVAAKSAEERKLPLVQSLKPGEFIVDKQTGQEADRFSTTIEDIQRGGGEKRYVHLTEKQYQQFQGVKEARVLLGEYDSVADQFTKTPGANFGQALTYYAKTKLGVTNPGVALEALRGSVLRLAGAMQGSRAQLSDKDVQAIQGMLPTSADTMQTAKQRLAIVGRILDAMQGTLLGTVTPQKLREQVESLPTYSTATGGSSDADERARKKFLK